MWVIAFIIGLLTGVLTGMISVGGGVIVTSLLILFTEWLKLGLNMKEIAMTTSFNGIFTSLSGAVYYYLQKLVSLKVILYFGVPALLSSLIFSRLANSLGDEILKGFFTFFSLIAVISILFPKKETVETQGERFSPILAISLSVGVGSVGGMIGVAAGFLYIPIFINIFRLPIKNAVGTGLVVGAMLATGTILGKLGGGYFRPNLTVPLILGGMSGVIIGGKIASFIKEKWLKLIMVIVMSGISIQLVFEYLYHNLQIPLSIVITVMAIIFVAFYFGFYIMNRPKKAKGEVMGKSSSG